MPPDWVPDEEGAAFVEVKKKVCAARAAGAVTTLSTPPEPRALVPFGPRVQGGEARYCQKCKRHKPPRTHHCRQCDRCVLRMDHHCVWLNNCVGHRNYKAFFLFLTCACAVPDAAAPARPLQLRRGMRADARLRCADVTVAVLHGLVLLIARALSSANANVSARQQARVVARADAGEVALVEAAAASSATQVAAIVISVPLVAALAMLLGWHMYLVAQNKTTVEYHEGVRARRTSQAHRRGEGRLRPAHIYDVGLLANVQAALGAQPLCWLLPGLAADGDGLSFFTADG